MRIHTPGRKPGQAKTGGRQPGSCNRKTQERQQLYDEAVLTAALTPEQTAELDALQVMRAVMVANYRAGNLGGALAAARELAPYTHARLSSSEVRISGQVLHTMSNAELVDEARRIEGRIAAAEAIH
jgi:hypothetical protein